MSHNLPTLEPLSVPADFVEVLHDRTPSRARHALLFGATLATLLSVTSMLVIPLGVMLVPIAESFHWSRTAVAGAFTALSLSQAVAFPVAGRVADRFGARRTYLCGLVALALTMLLIAFVPPSPLAFYGLFVIAGVTSVFGSAMVASKLVSEWFVERRGFWLGLVGGVGNGLGGMLMPTVAGALLVAVGWRFSFSAIAATMLVAGLPILYYTLREAPRASLTSGHEELTGLPFAKVMRSVLFWAIFTAVPFGGGALTGLFANTVTILSSQGITSTEATFAVALFALVTIVIEPLVGHILDGATAPKQAAAFYLVALAGLVLLANAHSPQTAIVGCVMTGFGLGAEFTVLPYMLSRYFGLREMGAISGVAFAGALIGNGISPIVLNASFDYFGRYDFGIYAVASVIAYALIVFMFLPAFPTDDRFRP